MNAAVLTVSQVNFFIKSLIEGDGRLQSVVVSGELSNFTDHYRSGHLYFSLKDEKSVLKAVMFASAARRLKFRPQDGMKVLIRGRVAVYEPTGQYQLYAEDMQPEGIGALSLAFQQLKERLAAQGLFDREHKRAIPAFPERIGVVTSPTGAAVRDILQITARRWPLAKIVLAPVLVQGSQAPGQIVAALRQLDRQRACDVIILGRGGGSLEDLWAFNDEQVARAVYACSIPVVSAVGHETDYTICDFVADLRAPTPSAAGGALHPRLAGGPGPGAGVSPVLSPGCQKPGGVPAPKPGLAGAGFPPGPAGGAAPGPPGSAGGLRRPAGTGAAGAAAGGAEAPGGARRHPGRFKPLAGAFPGLRDGDQGRPRAEKRPGRPAPGEQGGHRLARGSSPRKS